MYQGIAERNFERKFQLAENIHVRGANLVNGLLYIDLERVIPEAKKPRNAVTLEFFVRHHFALLLTHIDHGHAVGTGVARVQATDNQRRIGNGVAAQHVAQGRPVRVGRGTAAPAVQLLLTSRY